MNIQHEAIRVQFTYPNPHEEELDNLEDPPSTLELRVDTDDLKTKGRVTLSQNNALYLGELTLPAEVLLEATDYIRDLLPAPTTKPRKGK